MALPFWIAMATECSTSVAASSRDQRDRCSDAAPLIRSSTARASGPSPPHVSMTKGRSSASWEKIYQDPGDEQHTVLKQPTAQLDQTQIPLCQRLFSSIVDLKLTASP